MSNDEATQMYCDKSGAKEGEDNSTHHLVSRAAGMVCKYCGRTQQQIVEGAKS